MRLQILITALALTAGSAFAADETETGEYIAQLGDCAACHTAPGGAPFAGGLAIASPFGDIYTTNITPDPQYGIGDYTLEEFDRAVRRGVRKDGANLYPAMPYTSYAKVSDADMAALYAYFMKAVAPVHKPAPASDLRFPFNIRFGMEGWDIVNRPEVGFTPPYDDAQLNRGAYIVEGLGHCGACHSPRNLMQAQEGYTAASDRFLTGGTLGVWPVPDLRGPESAPQKWSDAELVEYLTTGRNAYTAATGEMALVVERSMQHATEADMDAIVAYLKHIGLPAAGSDKAAATGAGRSDDTTAMLTAAKPDMPEGARLYLDNCGACHTVSGQGAPRVFPNLVGNSLVLSDNPGGFIEVILKGAMMPSTRRAPAALAMPGFGDRLSDDDVAALASFIRSAWMNDASKIESEAVKKVRGQL